MGQPFNLWFAHGVVSHSNVNAFGLNSEMIHTHAQIWVCCIFTRHHRNFGPQFRLFSIKKCFESSPKLTQISKKQWMLVKYNFHFHPTNLCSFCTCFFPLWITVVQRIYINLHMVEVQGSPSPGQVETSTWWLHQPWWLCHLLLLWCKLGGGCQDFSIFLPLPTDPWGFMIRNCRLHIFQNGLEKTTNQSNMTMNKKQPFESMYLLSTNLVIFHLTMFSLQDCSTTNRFVPTVKNPQPQWHTPSAGV